MMEITHSAIKDRVFQFSNRWLAKQKIQIDLIGTQFANVCP